MPAHPSISQHQHMHKMQVQMQRTTHENKNPHASERYLFEK